MEFQMKLKRFLKQETVLSVAAVLAVLSMQLVLVLSDCASSGA